MDKQPKDVSSEDPKASRVPLDAFGYPKQECCPFCGDYANWNANESSCYNDDCFGE